MWELKDVWMSDEFAAVQKHYGNQRAIRSQVPKINHII